ncbi:hypothetical protein GPECTOR_4g682 [Gonium pectorale]|uniref:CSC1/OSCA1-like cytosolic domain-containing protein n=1 Tax=Gonium pectorale TaxID=33097 RepID=A0A150GXK4_GONPE|nr:hypothetical protein GPECTOR_4g682 [Gonium pectorale]|eukprot:KXZ54617.1 hypothetical protein GPECTOR_4g682 [Gonium pectorale]
MLPWLVWMMLWMMLCSLPYLIVINTSVFTDHEHRHDYKYGVKMYDSFVLPSLTFGAILDDKKDNGTLQYMNTNVANTWKGPMRKGTFLTWISLLDAGATLAVTAAVVVLFFAADRWLSKVDLRTREVADYSVIVGGLPPTVTATEIGEYFADHFGGRSPEDKVMDVLLVKDLSRVLKECKNVDREEQLKRFVAKQMKAQAETEAGVAEAEAEAEAGEEQAEDQPLPTPAELLAGGAGLPLLPAMPCCRTDADANGADGGPRSSPPPARRGTDDRSNTVAPAAAAAVSAASGSGKRAISGPNVRVPKLSGDMTRVLEEAEVRIRRSRSRIASTLEEAGGVHAPTRGAFVTFNTEQMRIRVCGELPSGWWSALLLRNRYPQLTHGGRRWRIWARQAAPPEDYLFENLATRIRTNMLIQAGTGLVMLCLVVVCAALITWLSAQSSRESRNLKWRSEAVLEGVRTGLALATSAASAGGSLIRAVASGASLDSVSAASAGSRGRRLAEAIDAGSNKTAYDAFCSAYLPVCGSYANIKYPGAHVNMSFGSEWAFTSSTARLLYERPVQQELLRCSKDGACAASYCLPCYCLGLSYAPTEDASADFLAHVQSACGAYWTAFDLQRDGIKTGISFVIAAVNGLLVFVLRVLKYSVERHWTTTDTELSFAVWAYAVKLVNSVAVLLIVNCSSLRNLQRKALEDVRWEGALEDQDSWMKKLALDGLYDDFTPGWYEDVGFSIQVLMMINVAGPLIRSASEWAVRWVVRARLRWAHCGGLAPPEDYHAAFRTPQFTLEARTADAAFTLTLAALFGSGMPLCYLLAGAALAAELAWGRTCLLSMRQPAQRYRKHLPRFLLVLLPPLLLLHSCFGLWMHTYFPAAMASMDLVAAASSGLDKPAIGNLSRNKWSARITQPNGLALLIYSILLAVWLLFGRWIIWGALKLLGRSCVRLAALLRGTPEEDGASDVSFAEALSTAKIAHMLRGARTYRMHHLTAYRAFLTGGTAGRLWAETQGAQRYTRLTTFCVRVVVEVAKAGQHVEEAREVETFDVSEEVITTPPRVLLLGEGAPSAAAGEGSQKPGGAPTAAPVALSGVPSAALQAAVLAQAAALSARTGAVVKRISLRRSLVSAGVAGAGASAGRSGSLATAAASGAAGATAAASAGVSLPLMPSYEFEIMVDGVVLDEPVPSAAAAATPVPTATAAAALEEDLRKVGAIAAPANSYKEGGGGRGGGCSSHGGSRHDGDRHAASESPLAAMVSRKSGVAAAGGATAAAALVQLAEALVVDGADGDAATVIQIKQRARLSEDGAAGRGGGVYGPAASVATMEVAAAAAEEATDAAVPTVGVPAEDAALCEQGAAGSQQEAPTPSAVMKVVGLEAAAPADPATAVTPSEEGGSAEVPVASADGGDDAPA